MVTPAIGESTTGVGTVMLPSWTGAICTGVPGRAGAAERGARPPAQAHVGKVPPYSVVVSGSLPGKPLPDGTPGPSLYCAVIVKTVDAQTRSKTGINELLRD